MQDAMIQYSLIAYSVMAQTGEPGPRTGAKVITGANAPIGLYPCAPGGPNDYVYIYTTRAANHQWVRLCNVLGRDELAEDPRFATPVSCMENEAKLDAILSEWSRRYDKREAMEILGAAGIPAGAVFDTAELQADENMTARGIFRTVRHPTRGDFKMPSRPVKMSANDVPLAPAPLLGEHSESVLGDWLGLSAADVAGLKDDGAI